MYWVLRICEFQMHDSPSYVDCGKSRSCEFLCSLVGVEYWQSRCNVLSCQLEVKEFLALPRCMLCLKEIPQYICCAMPAVS